MINDIKNNLEVLLTRIKREPETRVIFPFVMRDGHLMIDGIHKSYKVNVENLFGYIAERKFGDLKKLFEYGYGGKLDSNTFDPYLYESGDVSDIVLDIREILTSGRFGKMFNCLMSYDHETGTDDFLDMINDTFEFESGEHRYAVYHMLRSALEGRMRKIDLGFRTYYDILSVLFDANGVLEEPDGMNVIVDSEDGEHSFFMVDLDDISDVISANAELYQIRMTKIVYKVNMGKDDRYV